jgi:hypothetical protein
LSVVNYVINWSEVDLAEALSLMNGARVKLTKDKIEWRRNEYELFVPPIKNTFRLVNHHFLEPVIIKNIQFSAYGWKDEDQFSVYVNGQELLANIYVKESAEKHIYNRSFAIQPNSELTVLFHNHSAHSNQIRFAVEYGKI